MTNDEIIAIAKATESADPGRDGYILPIKFARAIESEVLERAATLADEMILYAGCDIASAIRALKGTT